MDLPPMFVKVEAILYGDEIVTLLKDAIYEDYLLAEVKTEYMQNSVVLQISRKDVAPLINVWPEYQDVWALDNEVAK